MPTSIVDREHERATIQRLLHDARSGLSGALVLHGEPGIGKTALLDDARASATDLRVISTAGIEAEAEYAFGALHRILVPHLDRLERLSSTQRDALEVAFGLADRPPTNPFRVGVAALSLLADLAAGRPLLLCVDDAQWLDPESRAVLAFVARRLHAEGIALLFAVRDDHDAFPDFGGIPTLSISGLAPVYARLLLDRVVSPAIDPQVAERVVVASAGNPLALTDLGATWSGSLFAQAGASEPLPIGPELQAHYLATVRALPETSQSWLALAAAEPTGDLRCVARAAARLAIDDTASDAAEAVGIVTVRSSITFRHPLVRSAVYNGTPRATRRTVHRALADVLDDPADEERRIWHLAAATTGPDDDVALLLAGSARRARDRGGYSASADLLARAALLTSDPARRNRRLLAAAQAALQGGAPRRARELLEGLDHTVMHDVGTGYALLLDVEIDVQTGVHDAFASAPARDLRAARLLADDSLGDLALVGAGHHVINAEALIRGTTVVEIASEMRARRSSDAITAAVLEGFATLVLDGYEAAVPPIRRAIELLLAQGNEDRNLFRDLLGVTFSMVTWDLDAEHGLLAAMNQHARAVGALRDLDTVLYCQTMAATDQGDLVAADRFLLEGSEMRAALGATDAQWAIYRHPELLAWRNDLDGLADTFEAIEQASVVLGNGATASIARIARVIDGLGRGRYAEAAAVAQGLVEGDDIGVHSRVVPNLVEAAVRAGNEGLAASALATLERRTRASGTPLALGVHARAAALLASDADAENGYQTAIEQLASVPAPIDVARARLLYGEWLRRSKRRGEARDQLRLAYEQFGALGARAFAERARVELEATGERARKRNVETAADLTPQEEQVARLAAAGDTNAEIAEQLFISARTVDYHLRKVFRKLDIGSRRELRGRFD